MGIFDGFLGPKSKPKQARNFDSLLKALSNRDDDIREKAARELGDLRDQRAVAALIPLLKDNDWSVRSAVVVSLGKLGNREAIKPLIPMLKDTDEDVRRLAVDALKRIGGPDAEKALEEFHHYTKTTVKKTEKAKAETTIKGNQEKDHSGFGRLSDSGLCDVCNRGVSPGEAYLVPVDLFYSSRKFHDYLSNHPLIGSTIKTMGIEIYIAQMRGNDKTSHSAVCTQCIYMFQYTL